MNNTILSIINELFDSYDLFSETGWKEIQKSIKDTFCNISKEEISEIKEYLNEFYEYCLKYADILARKYKTPFLPKSEPAQKEISEYVI